MIETILRPDVVLKLLLAGAVGTPLLAIMAWIFLRTVPRRLCILFGALGPVALGFWFLYLAILSVFGFDSIYSAIIVISLAVVSGIGAGFWAGGER